MLLAEEAIRLFDAHITALSQQEAVGVVENSDFIGFGSERKKAVRELYEGAFKIGDKLYTYPQPQKVDSCDCGDKSQCWEPCGELGHSEDHVVDANKMVPQSVEVWIDDLEDAAVGYVTGAPEAAKELARTASKNLRTLMAGKTLEEVRELTDALMARNIPEVQDAIVDIYVTLVIQASMQGLTMDQCIDAAYEVISKRTGKMVNGQFVKDAK